MSGVSNSGFTPSAVSLGSVADGSRPKTTTDSVDRLVTTAALTALESSSKDTKAGASSSLTSTEPRELPWVILSDEKGKPTVRFPSLSFEALAKKNGIEFPFNKGAAETVGSDLRSCSTCTAVTIVDGTEKSLQVTSSAPASS